MSVTRADVVKFIEEMTVLELSEFIKELEAKFGVSAAAPVVAVAGPAAGAGSAAAVEKTEFDVILQSFGEKKIQVIKVVREITGLGLKEAKDLVEGVPKAVKEGIPKEDATAIAKKLEESGAVVQVK